METYLYSYLFMGIFLLVGIVMGLLAFFLNFLLRPKRITGVQSETTYECGIAPDKDARIQFNVRYIIFALLFVAFDVEAVFLYPWAVQAKQFGLYALFEVVIFITILLVGYLYVWGRGMLKWD